MNKDDIKNKLAEDIVKYLKSGGKIDQKKRGESVAVDVTKTWPKGFYNDDNLTFTKKRPQ